MSDKKFNEKQQTLVNEFVVTYGLSEDQISFDGEKLEPIFDFEALCVLREKLTNFQSVDVSKVSFSESEQSAEAVCTIFLPNTRVIAVSDFAQYGEIMPDGSTIQNALQAKRIARARAMRSGIRAAGVNLLKAHQHFLETGDSLDFLPIDPRDARRREVHSLAHKLGLIDGKNKQDYQTYIGEMFDGRTSTDDLNDLELQRLATALRALNRLNNARVAAGTLAA